jgi:hypothetical protein
VVLHAVQEAARVVECVEKASFGPQRRFSLSNSILPGPTRCDVLELFLTVVLVRRESRNVRDRRCVRSLFFSFRSFVVSLTHLHNCCSCVQSMTSSRQSTPPKAVANLLVASFSPIPPFPALSALPVFFALSLRFRLARRWRKHGTAPSPSSCCLPLLCRPSFGARTWNHISILSRSIEVAAPLGSSTRCSLASFLPSLSSRSLPNTALWSSTNPARRIMAFLTTRSKPASSLDQQAHVPPCTDSSASAHSPFTWTDRMDLDAQQGR